MAEDPGWTPREALGVVSIEWIAREVRGVAADIPSGDGNDALAARLLRVADLLEQKHGVELANLRRWKKEATQVLAGWNNVYEALGRPGPLGKPTWLNAFNEVRRLHKILHTLGRR